MKRVSYIFPTSHHYRLPFHERLRALLAGHGIDYRVVYSDPDAVNRAKRDTVDIAWGIKVPTRRIGPLLYQHGLREALRSDLVIIQQENKLLLNYLCNLASMAGRMRVAYFGHGRNFQARDPNSRAERFKRFWATRADWWFGYTDATRRHVESLGFPPERITVFQNAVDTGALIAEAEALSNEEVDAVAAAAGIRGGRVAIFVGGLYPDKRLDFLIEAAEQVRARIPDFELVIVGGGVELDRLVGLAASRPWLIVAGPRFGREKVALMRRASLFLMPGLVGLAVLDAAALGLPVVTTAWPWHSPEIAYLENGRNGVIVDAWEDVSAYADAVATLMLDDRARARLAEGARETGREFTVKAMAERFAAGVLAALGTQGLTAPE